MLNLKILVAVNSMLPYGHDVHIASSRGGVQLRYRRCAVVLAACLFGGVVGVASATNIDPYCVNVTLAGGGHCDGPRHTLWENEADGILPCAGQLDQNGNWTGSYACGSTQAWGCYSLVLLYPRLHNHDSSTHNGYHGKEGYGSPPGACPP